MITFTREKFARYLAHCPPGFEADALARATVTETSVELTPEVFAELRNKHLSKPPRRGLGDKIERAVKPIARALGLKCLDEAGNLKPDSKCAKRRDRLNRRFPHE